MPAPKACSQCQQGKIRCDAESPCQNCHKHNRLCKYDEATACSLGQQGDTIISLPFQIKLEQEGEPNIGSIELKINSLQRMIDSLQQEDQRKIGSLKLEINSLRRMIDSLKWTIESLQQSIALLQQEGQQQNNSLRQDINSLRQAIAFLPRTTDTHSWAPDTVDLGGSVITGDYGNHRVSARTPSRDYKS